MKARRRALYLFVRGGLSCGSLAAVALQAPRAFGALDASSALTIFIATLLYALLLRINVPSSAHLPGRRRRFDTGRLTLQIPVALTLLTVYGPAIAASSAIAAYLLAIPGEGRARIAARILDGGAEAALLLTAGSLAGLLGLAAPLSIPGYALFTLFYAGTILGALFAIWIPLRTLSRNVLLIRLWRDCLRDTRALVFLVLLVSWAFVCVQIWARAGVTIGLTAFIPLVFMAGALRALHDNRIEIHRLRLARDAVQAMLGARDPLPQMNLLLSGVHTSTVDETLQIFAAITPDDDRLAPLATLGPAPTAVQFESCRRALWELQRNTVPSAVYRTRTSVVTAYAVRTTHDDLLGALVVHRPAHTSSMIPARRFLAVAAELAPLLRDFRSIAATQSAASIDVLTGLPNRRTIMELLRERIEFVSLDNPCAVLILDIDRFKAINDTLGHQAGDQCLRSVGQIIANNIRGEDRAGRIGGEEFVILMPDTTSELALSVGERLRSAIEAAEMQHQNGDPVTASIGVAVASISDTVDSLLARADRALYAAKRQGRNRVVEIGA